MAHVNLVKLLICNLFGAPCVLSAFIPFGVNFAIFRQVLDLLVVRKVLVCKLASSTKCCKGLLV